MAIAKKATAAKKPAAKKTTAKKPAAKKLGKIIVEIDGQQIDVKAIEKKIFDANGKSVDLF